MFPARLQRLLRHRGGARSGQRGTLSLELGYANVERPDSYVVAGERDFTAPQAVRKSLGDGSASLLLAALWAEAGLPDGVFNVVQGDKVAVDAILGHPDIRAVSFVGSTPIARYVYENGTAKGKRVQALGGAKNHMVVLFDADLDLAADARPRPGSVRRGSAAWRSPRWSPSTRSAMSW